MYLEGFIEIIPVIVPNGSGFTDLPTLTHTQTLPAFSPDTITIHIHVHLDNEMTECKIADPLYQKGLNIQMQTRRLGFMTTPTYRVTTKMEPTFMSINPSCLLIFA